MDFYTKLFNSAPDDAFFWESSYKTVVKTDTTTTFDLDEEKYIQFPHLKRKGEVYTIDNIHFNQFRTFTFAFEALSYARYYLTREPTLLNYLMSIVENYAKDESIETIHSNLVDKKYIAITQDATFKFLPSNQLFINFDIIQNAIDELSKYPDLIIDTSDVEAIGSRIKIRRYYTVYPPVTMPKPENWSEYPKENKMYIIHKYFITKLPFATLNGHYVTFDPKNLQKVLTLSRIAALLCFIKEFKHWQKNFEMLAIIYRFEEMLRHKIVKVIPEFKNLISPEEMKISIDVYNKHLSDVETRKVNLLKNKVKRLKDGRSKHMQKYDLNIENLSKQLVNE